MVNDAERRRRNVEKCAEAKWLDLIYIYSVSSMLVNNVNFEFIRIQFEATVAGMKRIKKKKKD